MGKKGKGSTRLPSGSSSGALGGLSPLQDRLLQQRVQAFCKVPVAGRRTSSEVAECCKQAMHTNWRAHCETCIRMVMVTLKVHSLAQCLPLWQVCTFDTTIGFAVFALLSSRVVLAMTLKVSAVNTALCTT